MTRTTARSLQSYQFQGREWRATLVAVPRGLSSASPAHPLLPQSARKGNQSEISFAAPRPAPPEITNQFMRGKRIGEGTTSHPKTAAPCRAAPHSRGAGVDVAVTPYTRQAVSALIVRVFDAGRCGVRRGRQAGRQADPPTQRGVLLTTGAGCGGGDLLATLTPKGSSNSAALTSLV